LSRLTAVRQDFCFLRGNPDSYRDAKTVYAILIIRGSR
jgi:hypothetical protein